MAFIGDECHLLFGLSMVLNAMDGIDRFSVVCFGFVHLWWGTSAKNTKKVSKSICNGVAAAVKKAARKRSAAIYAGYF